MKIKNLWLVLWVLAVIFCASCGESGENVSGDETDKTINADDYYEFTIITGEKAVDDVITAATKLQKALEEASGKNVKMGTDNTETTEEAKYEILVGITKRDASKLYSKMSPRSFVIDYIDSKIVIRGGTNSETIDAVNYFIENYLSSGEDTIKLARGEKYEYVFDYPDLLIGELDMSGYTIVNADRLNTDYVAVLRRRIKDVFGYEMPLTDTEKEKNLLIKLDPTLGEGCYKNYVEGDTVYITGADSIALGTAFNELLNLVPSSAEEGEIISLEITKQGIVEPSILDDIKVGSSSQKYFIVNTDKGALDYKVGETIKFEIQLTHGDVLRSCPMFKWNISPEGGENISGVSAGGSGKLLLEAVMDEPGFVLVTVQACDEEGNVIGAVEQCSAGACAGFDDINPAAQEPDDFDEFWEKQLERLDAVEPVAIDMFEEGSNNDYYVYDVKVDCLGNKKWTGETYSAIYVSVPKNADEESLGIFVNFMGAGVRSTETHLAKKSDYICVSVNGHSIPSKMGGVFYSDLEATTLSNYSWKDANDAPEEIFYSYMVMRDLQAIRFVKEYFGERGENLWDGERLEVAGMSEGGYQALFTAALDQDVSLCTAHIPAMCDKQGVNIGRKNSYGPSTPSTLYYDACFFARRIECLTKITVGLGDVTCVPSGITAMYNELKCDKEIVYVQNMGHTYPDANKVQQKFEKVESAEN